MINVGFVGLGRMGSRMATHALVRGDFKNVYIFDIDSTKLTELVELGGKIASSSEELSSYCDVICVAVPLDEQLKDVLRGLVSGGRENSVIVINSNHHPETIIEVGHVASEAGMALIDAPILLGNQNIHTGTAVTTVGGAIEDLEKARPILDCFCSHIHHVGPLGSGMVIKAMDRMLHCAINIANHETLLLGKTYGIDAEKARKLLSQLPSQNRALENWERTYYTWTEKDMDTALDLAQKRNLPLPLYGLVDQLIKLPRNKDVKNLLFTDEISYLGREYESRPPKIEENSILSNLADRLP